MHRLCYTLVEKSQFNFVFFLQAVKLEGDHTRYLAVVSCIGRQDTEESVVLGMDLLDKAHIGLVLPIWAHTHIKLDGDG